MPELRSLRLPIGAGLVLDAVDTGPVDGPVALLLHGFPQSSWCWRDVWPALASAGLHVVAPDQRGYSPDARPTDVQDYRMAALVGDAVAVLDAVGADRAHVVGHDWGAAVAWQLAGRHPDRVRTPRRRRRCSAADCQRCSATTRPWTLLATCGRCASRAR